MNKATSLVVFSILLIHFSSLKLYSQSFSSEDLISDNSKKVDLEVKKNIDKLGLTVLSGANHILFMSPIKVKPDIRYYENLYFSSYVDHSPIIDSLLDYNCGTRTYDKSNGYNHLGTDFTFRPFKWTLMQNEIAEVIAAATGVIVYREDGHYDMNCTAPDSLSNMVVLWHPQDGSKASYVHLKKYSLTSKQVGDTVFVGEHIGFVGSSGIASGPHLHFEVKDSSNHTIDPFWGPCNSMNADSWWMNQFPYHDQTIMSLTTHERRIDEGNGCNDIEILYYKDQFLPGDSIYVYAYIRSYSPGDNFSLKIIRPDGSVLSSSSNITVSGFYPTIRILRGRYLASNEPTGIWHIEAKLTSPQIAGGTQIKKKYFCVGQNPAPNASFSVSSNGQNFSLVNTSTNSNTYLWSFGDGTYSNLETPSHTYQTPGNYQICLIASNGCDLDTSCTMFSTGIPELQTNNDILIFPNPSMGKFQLSIDSKVITRNPNLEIYNLQGKVLYKTSIKNPTSIIDLGNQANGVYIIKIYDGQTIYSKKITIIQ